MNHSTRLDALRAISADLYWTQLPYHEPCRECGGEGRIGRDRTPCGACKGIGYGKAIFGEVPAIKAAELLIVDREMQAANVPSSMGYGISTDDLLGKIKAREKSLGSRGHGVAWSDPTLAAVIRGVDIDIRGDEVRLTWFRAISDIHESVRAIDDMVSDALGYDPTARAFSMKLTQLRLEWLTVIPHDQTRLRAAVAAMSDEQVAELDHAIAHAARVAQDLRCGSLVSPSNKRVPSILSVLESARKITEAAPPKPKQKPLEGCVSCARDGGHFTPIDTKNHNARSMCRRCGDYTSGEGSWPPLAAVQYANRTGKQWTWKIIEEAKRSEKAS